MRCVWHNDNIDNGAEDGVTTTTTTTTQRFRPMKRGARDYAMFNENYERRLYDADYGDMTVPRGSIMDVVVWVLVGMWHAMRWSWLGKSVIRWRCYIWNKYCVWRCWGGGVGEESVEISWKVKLNRFSLKKQIRSMVWYITSFVKHWRHQGIYLWNIINLFDKEL